MAPLFKLPTSVDSLPQIWVFVNYSIVKYMPSDLPFSLEYRLLFTKIPNGAGTQFSNLELVVYLYSHDMWPRGLEVGSVTIPVMTNGTLLDETWSIWVYNGNESGGEEWTTVWLAPSINETYGSIGLNLTGIIYVAFEALTNKQPGMWNMSSLSNIYLDYIELSHEFKATTQLENVYLDIVISQYYLIAIPYWSNATELTLIPSGAKSNVVVIATPANPYAGAFANYLYITPNLWNIDRALSSGYAETIYNATQGALYIHVNFTQVYPPAGVVAYSEFMYGQDTWGLSTPAVDGVRFPISIADLGVLLSFINYTLMGYSPGALFDWTYDLWLTTSPSPRSGAQNGDIELMIFLYDDYSNPYPYGWGLPVANVSVPIWVNGTLVNETFNVWIRNPTRQSITWTIVIFRPIPNELIPRGLVGVNITEFIQLTIKYLTALYPEYWNYTYLVAKYLNGIEFGSEWGAPVTHNIILNWVIYNAYLIRIPTLPLITPPRYPSLTYIGSIIPWCRPGNLNLTLTPTVGPPGPWALVNYSGSELLLNVNM